MHLTDTQLERYYLGMIRGEEELAPMEEHLLWCEQCLTRAKEAEEYIDCIRAAAVLLDTDGGEDHATMLRLIQGGKHHD